MAHEGSGMLVKYAEFYTKEFTVFNLDSIVSPMIACPYDPRESIVEATAWMFLEPMSNWHDTFIDFIDKKLKQIDEQED